MDYLPLDPDHPEGDCDVFNVSGDSDFYEEFKDSQEVTFQTSATNTSNWSMGGADARIFGSGCPGTMALSKPLTRPVSLTLWVAARATGLSYQLPKGPEKTTLKFSLDFQRHSAYYIDTVSFE
ncbi:MAG: hypothetical protein JRK53_08340 [Deltaproteobacteria bacterium]|nr:hypothetical protein [Deltaproteobacteria bacterium]MBW1817598.1 hypothetical protein [Deltaproteobacteria bacterium]MBW2284404.1 hypothetical protein [Deltaproteobacteria bacterium]